MGRSDILAKIIVKTNELRLTYLLGPWDSCIYHFSWYLSNDVPSLVRFKFLALKKNDFSTSKIEISLTSIQFTLTNSAPTFDTTV